jgi:hypothetical protein
MYPVPKEWIDVLQAPHQMRFWAQVWSGVRLLDADVRIVEGSVTGDSTQDIRYTADVTLDFNFETRLDLRSTSLNVYSGRVALFCSITAAKFPEKHSGSLHELVVPLGHYRVTDMQQQDLGLVKLDLEGYEGYVQDDLFTTPRTAEQLMLDPITGKKDDRVIAVITRLIQESFAEDIHSSMLTTSAGYDKYLMGTPYWAWHGMDVLVEVTDRALLDLKISDMAPVERDRWAIIKWLAETYNLDVFCGSDGKFHIRENASRRSAFNQFPAVWTVRTGAHGVLTTISHSVSRDNVYNAVIAYKDAVSDEKGSATEPVEAAVYENDPHSPVYWKGPFGRKPLMVTGDYANKREAQLEALVKLNDAYGYNSEMSFGSVPNPALEPADLIYVQYPDGRIEKHVIDSLTIPLGHAGTMNVKTKAKSELRWLVWQDPSPRPRTQDEILTSPYPLTTGLGGAREVYRWRAQNVTWMKARRLDNLTMTQDAP